MLDLSDNAISQICNLDNLNLVRLELQGNCITQLTGLARLPKLRHLDLSRNQIKRY